jgi:hypothetical protein
MRCRDVGLSSRPPWRLPILYGVTLNMVRRKKERKDEMFDLSNRVFPYPQDFSNAFPKLSDGTIEYSQTGPRGRFSLPHEGHEKYIHESSLQIAFPMVRCNQSPVCRHGGFELWETICSLLAAGKSEGEFELNCAGFTGRRRPNTAQPCRNTLRCRITLQYKQDKP